MPHVFASMFKWLESRVDVFARFDEGATPSDQIGRAHV